ncbi:hypothetical protein EYF80_064234 [Liparis tanakae]|uniref:Secreted protein n=1 Tax=Liparis tanakae TaxID=230148 RepID=A0A4Z2E9U6_9TELE|nr:hypothetical protein EYF80_064234 [Liparis tanakae]
MMLHVTLTSLALGGGALAHGIHGKESHCLEVERMSEVSGSQSGAEPPPTRRATAAMQSFVVTRLSQGNWLSITWGRSSLSFLSDRKWS